MLQNFHHCNASEPPMHYITAMHLEVNLTLNLALILTQNMHESQQAYVPPIFGLFTIFDSNFAKIVVPPSDGNEHSLVHLNGHFS